MKATLNDKGLDCNSHRFKGGWYYEEPGGLGVYSCEAGGYIGQIPWRSIEASLRRKRKAREKKEKP